MGRCFDRSHSRSPGSHDLGRRVYASLVVMKTVLPAGEISIVVVFGHAIEEIFYWAPKRSGHRKMRRNESEVVLTEEEEEDEDELKFQDLLASDEISPTLRHLLESVMWAFLICPLYLALLPLVKAWMQIRAKLRQEYHNITH